MSKIKSNILNEVLKEYEDMTMHNFSYDREYIKSFNFVTVGSSSISVKLINYALKHLDRKNAIEELMKYVKYEFIADEIEKSIFEFALVNVTVNNFSHNFVEYIYNDKLYDLCCNLDQNNTRIDNKTLLSSILEMRIKPSIVAFLPPEQLHPKRFIDILNKMELREKTMSTLQTTDLYRCKKCGERKFKISTMQTRCADEPETKFLTCLVCYNTFTK